MRTSAFLHLTAAAVLLACGPSAFGAALITAATGSIVNPDPNDAFEGATINAKSTTYFADNPGNVQDNAADMFGAVTPWHVRPGVTHFGGTSNANVWDGSSGTLGPHTGINKVPHFVNFSTAEPVTIAGVRMTSTAEPYRSGATVSHHSIIRFRLFGSSDNGATFAHMLSDVKILEMPQAGQPFNWNNPNYSGEYGSTQIVLTDYFDAPVTFQFFRAEFHVTNRSPNDFFIGEIDALPVPEPTALAGLALSGGALLLRRRRASHAAGEQRVRPGPQHHTTPRFGGQP